MLRKAADIELPAPDWSKLTDAAERKLVIRCATFPEAIQKAARELDSSTVASYLLDLAKDFSTFYRNCPVLNAEDPSLKAARLQLSARVRDILRAGLSALTINTLESM